MSAENLIETFYKAFQQKDAKTMASCYRTNIQFEDPAFGKLSGKDVSIMWQMLCESGKDLRIDFSTIKATDGNGSVVWEAYYTFQQTGNKVHNIINASFKLESGKIIEHIDSFNLHRWARQALGWQGWLFGGTTFFRNKLQKQTRRALENYKQKIKK